MTRCFKVAGWRCGVEPAVLPVGIVPYLCLISICFMMAFQTLLAKSLPLWLEIHFGNISQQEHSIQHNIILLVGERKRCTSKNLVNLSTTTSRYPRCQNKLFSGPLMSEISPCALYKPSWFTTKRHEHLTGLAKTHITGDM